MYGTMIDILVYDNSSGLEYYIAAVVGDIKNHTYPNRMYHTGMPYPESGDKTVAIPDYSYVEIISSEKPSGTPFKDIGLIIKEIIVYEKK
ncbi:hypothetical protein LJC58_10000 [Lachnospiraceae bacterium OttesenSCG-928-D06]|nr:hypothetical protein [Lachnospiraceae bacterium OttesenSCG-928-D06]